MSVTGVIQLVALFYMCYRLASNVVVSYTWSEANNPSFVSVTGVVSDTHGVKPTTSTLFQSHVLFQLLSQVVFQLCIYPCNPYLLLRIYPIEMSVTGVVSVGCSILHVL
jgi:hypothetical protein